MKSKFWHEFTDHSRSPTLLTGLIFLTLVAMVMVAVGALSGPVWIIFVEIAVVVFAVAFWAAWRIRRILSYWRFSRKSRKRERMFITKLVRSSLRLRDRA